MVVVDIVKNVIIDGIVVVVLFDLVFHEVGFDFMLNFNLGIIPVAQQEFLLLCPAGFLAPEISVWYSCCATGICCVLDWGQKFQSGRDVPSQRRTAPAEPGGIHLPQYTPTQKPL
jgi:hypothetical protein